MNRRRVLRGATVTATGLGGIGVAAGRTSATTDSVTGSLFVGNCPGPWESAPEGYPTIDLTADDPEAGGAFPTDADELAIYVHGFLEEFSGGSRDQAYTLQTAFEENGYEEPAVAAFWDSNTPLFPEAQRRAEVAGRRLATFLEESLDGETTVRLVGHSLGSQVSLEALTCLDETVLDSVALLGAAVDPDTVCDGDEYAAGISGAAAEVHSYHSRNDAIVCGAYAASEATPGLGCAGSECGGFLSDGSTPDEYEDIDVTDDVAAHCDYLKPDDGCIPRVIENFG